MPERPRKWVRFARMLLPEMRLEEALHQWIADEDVERVLAYLEVWNKHKRAELDDFMAALAEDARLYTRQGGATPAGHRRFERATEHEQERMLEVQRRIREIYLDIDQVDFLIRYAHKIASGTLKIEDADREYEEIVKRRLA